MHAALMGSTYGRRSRLRVLPAAILTLLTLLALAGTAGAVAPPPPQADCPQTGVASERRVCSAVELDAVLRSPDFTGRVLVPSNAQWEMTDPCGAKGEFGQCVPVRLREIPVHSGVQVIGERGALAARPLLYTNDKWGDEHYPLFRVVGNHTRIEGLHLRGPEAGSRADAGARVDAIQVVEDPGQRLGRWVVIADNEINEWPDAGVAVSGTVKEDVPSAAYTGPRMTRADAGLIRVERNYIHNNARDQAGYGVEVDGSAYVTIEGNVFDFNRHDVSADYLAYKGYIARFNYLLEGGFQYGQTYGQHFDVHGSGNAESRKDHHYDGGTAGEYFQIAYNTIRGAQTSGLFDITRPAFELRGKPSIGAEFTDNVLVHGSYGEAIKLKPGVSYSPDPTVYPGLNAGYPSSFNLTMARNEYDTDHSGEIAAGDFDGDGRTDVFVANGTAWFFSRAGQQPWELLHESTKLTGELAFADVDNDGVTDVLYRDGSGRLGYLKSGRAPLAALTTVPVAIRDLRFVDFDGDGKTDIFYTRANSWHVWYGRDRQWTQTGSSGEPLAKMLFGEFDAVKGTDIAAAVNGGWSYSSASTAPWARLNATLMPSFASATAADFDADGRTDIAFGSRRLWKVSLGGRGPLQTLRIGPGFTPVNRLLLGHFDAGNPRVQAVGFDGSRLFSWHGLGNGNSFRLLSRQPMS
jgi:hypothetical protein